MVALVGLLRWVKTLLSGLVMLGCKPGQTSLNFMANRAMLRLILLWQVVGLGAMF
jgi:hypothetical protein